MENPMRKNTICITGCDSYLGQCMGRYFLKESEHEGRMDCCIRVMAQDPRCCEELKEMGAECCVVDFDKPETVVAAFKDCDFVVMIPEMTRHRVANAQICFEAMKSQGVCNVLLMSCVGANTNAASLQHLRQHGEIEKCMVEMLGNDCCCCIFRNAFIQQMFQLWMPMMKEENKIKMNITDDGCLSPVNVNDICCAAYDLFTAERREHCPMPGQVQQGFRMCPMDSKHNRQCYTITGPQSMSGDEIADCLSGCLDMPGVVFEDCSRHEMKRYLQRTAKDKQYRESCMQERSKLGTMVVEGMMMPGVMMGQGQRKGAGWYQGRPLVSQLTEIKIDTILDMLEYAGQGGADFTSADAKKIMGVEPESLDQFVKRHCRDFRCSE